MYDYTAVNILTQIDALSQKVPGARRCYDQLSEIVHPNVYGALYYFVQPKEDHDVHFRTLADERSPTIGLLLAGASLFGVILDDLLRFQSRILRLMANTLQERTDEYESRKPQADNPD